MSRPALRWAVRGVVAWVLVTGSGAWAAFAPLRAEPPALPEQLELPTFFRWADAWQQYGFDAPERAQAVLTHAQEHPADGVPAADWVRVLSRTRALVAAGAGDEMSYRGALSQLQALAGTARGPSLARADAALAQAMWEVTRSQAAAAAQAAQQALAEYRQICNAAPPPLSCDERPMWRASHVAALSTMRQGQFVDAMSLAQDAVRLADRLGDPVLQTRSAAVVAAVFRRQGEAAQATRWLNQADWHARKSNLPEALARVRQEQSEVLAARGDVAGAKAALEEAAKQLRSFGSPRLEAQMGVELSSSLVQERQYAQALAVVNEALPVVRRFKDHHVEAPLLHNGGLARLGLGRISAGQADLEAALALWRSGGAHGSMLVALREHSDALAQRGEYVGAIALHHREQALREEMQQSNREASLRELRKRYRTEAEQLELTVLERDNSVKAARLENQRLQQRIWAVAAGLLLAALGAVALLVKRTRDANLQLRRSEALLRVQSERDPLTGLANRRHFRDVLAAQSAGSRGFEGGLLLIDIDHFKRINDDFGHAAGDAVLVELGRRLSSTVRSGDLVCRWGGEEFLIYIPGLGAEGMAVQARRLLAVVGDTPISLPDGRALPVTASMGYGRFPLPRQAVPLNWEQAVNLADMALYSAKGRGRDCAAGLIALTVSDVAALQEVERDFEHALNQGVVMLSVHARPH